MKNFLGQYILNDVDEVVPCNDTLAWGEFMQNNKRRIACKDYADYENGQLELSTVFLGLDHNHADSGPPILFETMLFHSEAGPLDDIGMMRYSTLEEAREGHKIIWLRIQQKIADKTLRLE